MKICLFGGTFDPPHMGHLIIAETIKDSRKFDKVIFIPAFLPPHKQDNNISSIDDRIEMLRLALDGNEKFELSDLEKKRRGVSYTIQTIREIKTKYNLTRDGIFFLMGSDSLLEFHSWKNPEDILKECNVLVAIRPGFKPDGVSSSLLSQIQFAEIPRIEISSFQIRNRIRNGQSVKYMVADCVREYIKTHNLYISC